MAGLNELMPTLYAALAIVSREMVGFIPSVAINAAPTEAALNEYITVPKASTAVAEDIVPGTPTSNGAPDVATVQMQITKSRMVPVRWQGEEQLGVNNSGMLNNVMTQQFAQAMRTLVNEVEADLAGLCTSASRAYGTVGTKLFSDEILSVAMARKLLEDNGAPLTDLQLVIDTLSAAYLRSNGQLTKANEADTDATLRRGVLLDLMGFAVRTSAQLRTHTGGSITGTAAVNNGEGYNVGATEIAVDGATTIDLKAGDLLTFGTAEDKYVVAADVAATPLTLNAPGLISSIADDDTVSTITTYTPCLAFDRNALQLIARAPAMPQGGDEASDITTLTDPVSGISFQVAAYRGYREVRYEVGLAWGVKAIQPEHIAMLIS